MRYAIQEKKKKIFHITYSRILGWSECVRLMMVIDSRINSCTDFRWTLAWYNRDVYHRIRVGWANIWNIFQTDAQISFICLCFKCRAMRFIECSVFKTHQTCNTKKLLNVTEKRVISTTGTRYTYTHDNLSKQDNKLNNIVANCEIKSMQNERWAGKSMGKWKWLSCRVCTETKMYATNRRCHNRFPPQLFSVEHKTFMYYNLLVLQPTTNNTYYSWKSHKCEWILMWKWFEWTFHHMKNVSCSRSTFIVLSIERIKMNFWPINDEWLMVDGGWGNTGNQN